uniref:Uncharacterized protein n=1 Tax=Rhizophora mucronata TaxID=61149 RepID=A0A2P2KLE1_RHIMU
MTAGNNQAHLDPGHQLLFLSSLFSPF